MRNILFASIALIGFVSPVFAATCADKDARHSFMESVNKDKYSPKDVVIWVETITEFSHIGNVSKCLTVTDTGDGEIHQIIVTATIAKDGKFIWTTEDYYVHRTE